MQELCGDAAAVSNDAPPDLEYLRVMAGPDSLIRRNLVGLDLGGEGWLVKGGNLIEVETGWLKSLGPLVKVACHSTSWTLSRVTGIGSVTPKSAGAPGSFPNPIAQ